MDCFYAAIEMRDFPELASMPLAVGGDPNKRGVITTCNYAARKFGVHSAMATAHALKLCLQLKIQPVRMVHIPPQVDHLFHYEWITYSSLTGH